MTVYGNGDMRLLNYQFLVTSNLDFLDMHLKTYHYGYVPTWECLGDELFIISTRFIISPLAENILTLYSLRVPLVLKLELWNFNNFKL